MTDLDRYTPFTRGAAYLWGAKQAAKRVRAHCYHAEAAEKLKRKKEKEA